MNCPHADTLLQHGLDGRLSPRERAALDTHLAGCAACRAASDEYHILAQTTARWARETALLDDGGRAFTDAVMAQIAAAPRAAPPFWTPQTRALGVGVTLALAVLSFVVGPHLPPLPVFTLHMERPVFLVSVRDFVTLLSALPPNAAHVWDTFMATPSLPPRWLWGGLAAALGVNLAFAVRVRRAGRETLAP